MGGVVPCYGHSPASTAKFSRCNSDCMVPTAKEIHYLALYRKSFLTSGLGEK